jgi:hypothetical protein
LVRTEALKHGGRAAAAASAVVDTDTVREDDGAAMGTLRDVGDDGGDEGRWYERWETTGLSRRDRRETWQA